MSQDQKEKEPTHPSVVYADPLIAKWINEDERQQMIGASESEGDIEKTTPLVMLFQPDGPCVWMIAELDLFDDNIAYGLADLGVGCPEIGEFLLTDLAEIKGPMGLPLERDTRFVPGRTLGDYARQAFEVGRILR